MAFDSNWDRGVLEHAWFGQKWAQALISLSLFSIAAYVHYHILAGKTQMMSADDIRITLRENEFY